MNAKIMIATHKQFWMPKDLIYLPIHVGKEGKSIDLGFQGDNTGDNISTKNKNWCELTALYWGWKNLDCDYIGLVQYRRHFRYRKKGNKYKSVLNARELEQLLEKSDIILPQKRNYRVDTLREHFEGYDFSIPEDLENVKRIIHELTPEYDESFERVMSRKTGHMCNMFIMKKDLADSFCEWEFGILNEYEKCVAAQEKDIGE